MKAYIVQHKNKIEPFGDIASECFIRNIKLSDIQCDVLEELNISPISISDISEINDSDSYIILNDNIYFTRELLHEFIEKSSQKKINTICAIKRSLTALRTITALQSIREYPDHIEYNLHYVPESIHRSTPEHVIIEVDHIIDGIPMPRHMTGEHRYLFPINVKLIAQIDHWSILWSVNILSIFSDIAKLKSYSKFKLLALAIKKRSINQWSLLSKLNKIGNNCDIHPTAYIEGSVIGDNVSVGAKSIIRESIIGDDSSVGNGVTIEASVIGKHSSILSGHIMYSVLLPEVFTITQLISASIIGRESFIGSGVTLTDYRFDGNTILVTQKDNKVNTANHFLGACLGHRVYLGSGCIIAPGRIVSNDLRIVPDNDRVIMSVSNENKINGYKIIRITN